jgi:FkbM family methyltransferase
MKYKIKKEPIVIVDIGAANGFQSKAWEKFRDILKVIMFEPDERSYNNLSSMGFTVFKTALADKEGSRTLYLTRKPEVSSFYKPNRKYLDLFPEKERWDIVKTITVKTERLDSFQGLIDHIDFIKLDTQGSELEILCGANNLLETCIGIELEVEFLEIYQGQPLFGEVLTFLDNKNFKFYDFITLYRYGRKKLDRKGQLSFADALFLRTPEYVYEVLKDKVYSYLYACAAYEKYDLIQVTQELFNSNPEVISVGNHLLENK